MATWLPRQPAACATEESTTPVTMARPSTSIPPAKPIVRVRTRTGVGAGCRGVARVAPAFAAAFPVEP